MSGGGVLFFFWPRRPNLTMAQGIPTYDVDLKDIAEATGLSRSYISRIVSGERSNPSLDTLRKLASYFKCPMDGVSARLEKLRSNGKKKRGK